MTSLLTRPLVLPITSPLVQPVVGVGRRGTPIELAVPFSLAKTRRIDIVGIGDSNQIQAGFGWDHGFQYAMSRAAPMWATGLISQLENNGSGSNQGYLYSAISVNDIGVPTGAPAAQAKFLDKGTGGLFPADYAYVADGQSEANNSNAGLTVSSTCPLNILDPLAFDVYQVGFTTGTGAVSYCVRVDVSPFTKLTTAGPINTNFGDELVHKTTLSIAGNASTNRDVGLKLVNFNTAGITGPYFGTYMRARNAARATGFSYGTLEYRGGQSLRTMAIDLQQAANDTLTHYFGVLRADQGADPVIIIVINSGLNDRNETQTSVGPGAVADGDSPEAYVDNATAIVERIKAVWTLNGWNQDELWWMFMPSHRISDPDDAELVSYRAAIASYAATIPAQAQVINLANKITSAQMLANGWYASGGADTSHLTQAGYEGMGLLAVT